MKRRHKSRINKYFVSLAIGAFFILAVANAPAERRLIIIPEIYHAHADFKVFINGDEIDFSSPNYNVKDRKIHLHTDNDFGGNVIHVEGESATLGEFFSSLGMKFNSTCFAIDSEFCNTETKTLKFYVNGEQNNEYDKYSPRDLDRMLISYGNESDLSNQSNSITKLACTFSNKCPVPEGVKIVTL